MKGRRDATFTMARRAAVLVPSVVLEVFERGDVAATARVPLGLEERVVGTSDDVDIVLTDTRVSRRHASLRLTEKGLLVVDLQSKNGTTIDGVRIQSAYAPIDATLHVGETRLVPRSAASTEIALSLDAHFGAALGNSIPMRGLFARLTRLAATNETVLLLGESGTGKELLAHAVHLHSARREGPFVVVDCGSISAGVFESELFGHERGAFTGADRARPGLLEQASGGTIFLDEIGELPLDLQTRLLRALEQRAVRRVGGKSFVDLDVRVVAATHRDLGAMVRQGTFRSDLYYRLAVAVERVPPLRERSEDVAMLTENFLAKLSPPLRLEDLPPGTLAMLKGHTFPGNVRELFNVLRRLSAFPEDARAALAEPGLQGAKSGFDLRLDLDWRQARELALDTFEERYLRTQLEAHQGNVSRMAQTIGVSRQFLYRLLERHGIGARSTDP